MSHPHVQRLLRVREEYESVGASVARGLADPGLPGYGALRAASERLEDTYLVRLFAEFEGLLTDWLGGLRPRPPIPRTAERLIDRAALRAHVPDPVRLDAHAVRRYRNAVVHAGALAVPVVPFRRAFSALSRFAAVLP